MFTIPHICLLLTTAFAQTAEARAVRAVWFAPLDPIEHPSRSISGSPQYGDLFAPDARWQLASSRIAVFKIYPTWLLQASNVDLTRQFADLRRRGIALAIEYGPLPNSTDCATGITGEGSLSAPIDTLFRRITDNGGTLEYLAMDEPAYFAGATCKWEPERAAAAAAINARAAISKFPNLKIGDIEPLGGTAQDGLTTAEVIDRYRRFVNAFGKELGAPLSFFHADVNWNSPAFPSNLRSLRDMLAIAGVTFGVIYNGTGSEETDVEWISNAKLHMEEVEMNVGEPHDLVFQSWHDHPKKLLPEDDHDSFTWLINQLSRSRTILKGVVVGRSAQGQLTEVGGKPVPDANLRIYGVEEPALPEGARRFNWSIAGEIPGGTKTAVIGIRINTECGCGGPANLQIDRFTLRIPANKEKTWQFVSPDDLAEWTGLQANTKFGSTPSFTGDVPFAASNGQLLIAVPPTQKVQLNSISVPIANTGKFVFGVKGMAQKTTAESGYFAVIFLDEEHEISRHVIPFGTENETLLTETKTDSYGRWSISWPSGKDGRLLDVEYRGDHSRWPSDLRIRGTNRQGTETP